MSNRHRLTAGRHLSAGQLVRLIQDFYVAPNPCPDGNCNDNECEHDNPDCCDPLSGLGSDSLTSTDNPKDRTFYRADELFSQQNGGVTFAGLLGFGAINLLVPSHTQLYSENRSAMNDASKDTHSATFNISANLGYARYRKDYSAHDPMPSLSYKALKEYMPLTPRMSLGETSSAIRSVPVDKDSGGSEFQADNTIAVPDPVSTLTKNSDPRVVVDFRGSKRTVLDENINPEGLVSNTSYATLPFADTKTHVLNRITPAGDFFINTSNPIGGYIPDVKIPVETPVIGENTIVDPTRYYYTDGLVFYTKNEPNITPTTVRKTTVVTTIVDGKPVYTLGADPGTAGRETFETITYKAEPTTTVTEVITTTSDDSDGSVDSGTDAILLQQTDAGGGGPIECPPGHGGCDDCVRYCDGLASGNPNISCYCPNCNCIDDEVGLTGSPCACIGCEEKIDCICGDYVCGQACPGQCPPCKTCAGTVYCGDVIELPCPDCGGSYCSPYSSQDSCITRDCAGVCDGPGQLIDCPECGGQYCSPYQDPDQECQSKDCTGTCGGPGCPGPEENSCCPDDGSGPCSADNCDPCPDATLLELNGAGDIVSMKGNFTNRDLLPIGYFRHDFNLDTRENPILGERDVVLSSNLVLTVSEVYGRLPFVGARPFVRPLKLDVYELNVDINPDTVSCSQYKTGSSWTSHSGRNATDRSASPLATITIDTSVKPGDKIHIPITDIVRKAVSGTGVINFMIEASEWFAGSTGSDPAADARDKVAMLVQFHRTGNNKPKVVSNIIRNQSPATSRLSPGVARRRATVGL